MKVKINPVKNNYIEIDEKYDVLAAGVFMLISSVFTTWLIQYLLLPKELRDEMTGEMFWLNVCCCMGIYLVIQACTNRVGLSCMLSHVILIAFACINYFVYAFRGNEITFGDIKSLRTGISVASNYKFTLSTQVKIAFLVTIIFVIFMSRIKIKFAKHWVMRAFCLSLALLSFSYVAMKTDNTVTETWEQKGTYRNGFLLNFCLSIRDSFVEKPEHYSVEAIEKLAQEYSKNDTKTVAASTEKKPAIIAVMDESFANFEVLGDLQTNIEVTPFIDSLTQNTIKGYALAPVFGAKTPNSEWEFLTGNSTAWLPEGSVAYQQYFEKENAYSLVGTLKKENYTCVAMHPYYETGWSRNTIYPKLGFDEMYFLEDFDQSNLMREYVSDATMFDKIIERYEAKKGEENLFLMGITMQNHGGYRERYANFPVEVFGINIGYPDVNQYLSLAHQTDIAVEKLITYFDQVQEPVIICFFGDHQPSLNTSFYRKLNGKGVSGLTLDELEKFYNIPFFIWTNYDSESKTVEKTSINYLSTMLLQQAGIALPAYNRFLADLMEVVPAMNARGFYSEETGRYVHYGNGGIEEKVWLEKYQMLQYNGMFGDEDRNEVFFDIPQYNNAR
ncbi:MAG: LTA synthase family protein [Lachnospiraceae bacterium]|nr:LTA synthase family protein [Lachnospiraceae bacterium]